jgi:hypothetical protein
MKCWGCKWALEGVKRTSLKVKDFGPTPFDYISTDLDYKLLGKSGQSLTKQLTALEIKCWVCQ